MTSRSTDTVCIQRLGQELLLDPSGAVFWVERRTLFLADLHLGREATFQRASIALPYGATQDTLERAKEITAKFQPECLVILGDLIHAPCSMPHDVQKMIRQWLGDLRPVELLLIEGNHDRRSRQGLSSLLLTVLPPPQTIDPFVLLHDFHREFPEFSDPDSDKEMFSLAGHVHPGIRLSASQDTLRCFQLTDQCLTLPAFGELTGKKRIQPKVGHRIYATTGQSVFDVTELVGASRRRSKRS